MCFNWPLQSVDIIWTMNLPIFFYQEPITCFNNHLFINIDDRPHHLSSIPGELYINFSSKFKITPIMSPQDLVVFTATRQQHWRCTSSTIHYRRRRRHSQFTTCIFQSTIWRLLAPQQDQARTLLWWRLVEVLSLWVHYSRERTRRVYLPNNPTIHSMNWTQAKLAETQVLSDHCLHITPL